MSNHADSSALSRWEIWLRSLLFLFLIYLFLCAVKMFGASTDLLRNEYKTSVDALFSGMRNPFVGLCVGIFATALMNSSSATTSLVVALVAMNVIPIEHAVPVVIGANIGASITSMVVSLGNITNKKAFVLGYGVPFIQDWYSIITATVCLSLEFSFHFMSRTAMWLAGLLVQFGGSAAEVAGSAGTAAAEMSGSWLCNPIPVLVDAPVKLDRFLLIDLMHFPNTACAILMGILGLGILFFALVNMTKNMKILMADKVEEWINAVLSKNGFLGLFIGWIVTMIIQSSGITTSLVVPLVASNILKIRTAYPLILGAKLGTPITGILAALAFLGTPAGHPAMAIALVHFLFNAIGVGLLYPIPALRLPVFLTERLSPILGKHRAYVIMWGFSVFILI
ncbi:MAG: Na/Pi symporter, partial [Thermoguttaceae bacterium]|nr:Na/Pi symporter [Thermoguttaceae bacterium]